MTLPVAAHDSSEAAYQSLPLSDALKMLSMKSADELSDYAAMREREWEVDVKNNVVRFREDNKADLTVPSQARHAILCRVSRSHYMCSLGPCLMSSLASNVHSHVQKLIIETLSYAKELERIV